MPPSRRKSSLGRTTKQARAIKLKRKNETLYERSLRLEDARIRYAAKLQAETPEMRRSRLEATRIRMAKRRKRESHEQHAARCERHRKLQAARRKLSNEQLETRRQQKLLYDTEYFNQTFKDQNLLVYLRTVRNTVIAVSTNQSIPNSNEKVMSDAPSTSELVQPIKEESLP